MSKQEADGHLLKELPIQGGVQNGPQMLLADFLTHGEAADELKICGRTLDRWRRLGEGPPVTKLGRRILYRRSSVQEWLRTRERAAA